jgi:hypothetical protein
MKSSNNCITLIGNIFSTLVLCLSLSAPAVAEMLLADDFSGTSLAPYWTIQRGYADVAGGYVALHGSTVGRDANIQTAVGNPDWADYHISTHFIADGGGDNWYNAIVYFRMQELDVGSWTDGHYYGVVITTPLWPDPAEWILYKMDGVSGSILKLAGDIFDPSVPINDRDNVLDIWAVGNQFSVAINGYSLTSSPVVDNSDPYLYGGIGLVSIWESTTRYDYVNVTAVPEPGTYAMLLAGLGVIGFMAHRRKESAI